MKQHWPHAPPHWIHEAGSYFVTASTLHKHHIFDTPEKLDIVTELLLSIADEHQWKLRAWAVMSNHYHIVAGSPVDGGHSLRDWLGKLHRCSALAVNEIDQTPDRRVWFQFRDTQLTYQTSYLARLNYTNQNPVHHGLVKSATDYRWCSAAWFEKHAPKSFVKSVARFPLDRVKVDDDF
jgi:putative transposase